jgi:hypothetical protein
MNTATAIAAINAAITLIESLAPLVQQAVSKGEITVEQQAELDKRIQNLRPGGTAFAGPEWQVQ